MSGFRWPALRRTPASIRTKLFVIFAVAAELPIFALTLASYHNSLKAVEEMVGKRTERAAASVVEELNARVARRINDQILVRNVPLQSYLQSAALADASAREAAFSQVRRYLPDLFERYGDFYDELIVAGAHGEPLFRFDRQAGLESCEAQPEDPDPGAFALQVHAGHGELLARQGELMARRGEILARRFRVGADSLGRIRVQTLKKDQLEAIEKELSKVFEDLQVVFPRSIRKLQPPPIIPGHGLSTPRLSDEDRRAVELGRNLTPAEHLILAGPSRGDRAAGVDRLKPIFSVRSQDRLLGTLVGRLRTDYLFPADLDGRRFGEKGELLVVNRESGEILYHSRPGLTGRNLERVDPHLFDELAGGAGPNRPAAWTRIDGPEGERLASMFDVEGAPWKVVATSLSGEFESEARRAGIVNLILSGLALLMASAVVVVASGRISRSVQVVTEGARKISRGNLEDSIEVDTHDEISTLAETFNAMRVSLRENIALRERAAGELEALNRTLEDRVRERTEELEALNAALNEANRELKELDNLKSNFLATVSHEFKTPLTSIKAFTEILMDESEDRESSEEMKRFLKIINSESDRLGRLIKNLLDLSRIESHRMVWKMAVLPVRSAVAAAVDGLLPVFNEKDLRLECDLSCGDPRVHADPDRIQEVLANVLHNAAKVSPIGGRIRIGCREEAAGANGRRVRLWVTDEGPGIAPEDLERVFDRFSQVDSSRSRIKGGTGLGLAISREIMEHHRGRIWAESRPGEGATFIITLPLADDEGPGVAGDQESGAREDVNA